MRTCVPYLLCIYLMHGSCAVIDMQCYKGCKNSK
jgi:hypothetical protein